MSVDYLVSSLKPLAFDAPAPYTAAEFARLAGPVALPEKWRDLEAQLRNVLAEERARANVAYGRTPVDATPYLHATTGCALYWQQRMRTAFAEKDVRARQQAIDRVFWDAAGELTPVTAPLSLGALQTYAIRLALVQRRSGDSVAAGQAIIDSLLSESSSE